MLNSSWEPIREQSTPSILSSKVRVRPGDKWILIGTSGSGKTTALKYLDAAYSRLFPDMRHYVFDSKLDGDFGNWPGRVGGDTAPRKPGRNDRYQVWQPVQLLPEEIEKWLWGILHDAPAVLEVDELLHVSYKGGSQFNAILKTGRSLPVGVISLTQEMSQIPGNSYKQSDHRLGFYVDQAGRYDTQIRNSLLKAKMGDPKDPYGFWYQHKNGRGEPPYYPTVQKFLGV